MTKKEDDAQMRAQLALMQMESAEVDENGRYTDKPHEVHRLRTAGWSYRDIAKKLEFPSTQAAIMAHKTYKEKLTLGVSEARREEALDLSLSRCDELVKSYWSAAMLGDIEAANMCLKAIDMFNKLYGLYDTQKDTANVQQYVVINRQHGTYAEQLKEIAQGAGKTKEITNTN